MEIIPLSGIQLEEENLLRNGRQFELSEMQPF
jgi:hypothetical protein